MNRKKLIVGTLSVAMMASLLSVSVALAEPGKECRNDMPKIKNKHCQSEPTKPPKDTPPPKPTTPPIVINGVAYSAGGASDQECSPWVSLSVLQSDGWTPPIDVITYTYSTGSRFVTLTSKDGVFGGTKANGVEFSSCNPEEYLTDGEAFTTTHGIVLPDDTLRFVPDGWVENVEVVSKP